MMIDEKTKSLVAFPTLVLALVLFLVAFALQEKKYCFGIPLIASSELEQYEEGDLDFDPSALTFNGEQVPFDLERNTVYLSQSSDNLEDFFLLEGTLKYNKVDVDLFFLQDSALKNIEYATKNNLPLTVILRQGNCVRKINVILSTFPVLVLNGYEIGKDEEDRNIFEGNLSLFSGFDPLYDGLSVQTSNVEWHRRGSTTARYIYTKESLKLSLKSEDGTGENLDFVGMGSDDDWILNSMVLDDSKLREKFFMDFWNSFLELKECGYRMSCGEYVEVVINHEYRGLYLLQRRLDSKYLQLDNEKDILLKGIELLAESYGNELVSSPLDLATSEDILYGILFSNNGGELVREDFIDLNLMLNFAASYDNRYGKNIYFLLRYTDTGYNLYLIPWDTDMSFGIRWGESGQLEYDYDYSMNSLILRNEYYLEKECSDAIDVELSERWWELRGTIFDEETIFPLLEYIMESIDQSGALLREQDKNGLRYDGKDTWPKLEQYICERIAVLDQYYSEPVGDNRSRAFIEAQ